MNKSYPDNLKGAIILLFASLIWGSTFVPQKIAMDFWSPLQFTAIRFLIGAFLLLLIIPFFQLPKRLNLKPLIIYGLALGTFLGFAALFQQIGLVTVIEEDDRRQATHVTDDPAVRVNGHGSSVLITIFWNFDHAGGDGPDEGRTGSAKWCAGTNHIAIFANSKSDG